MIFKTIITLVMLILPLYINANEAEQNTDKVKWMALKNIESIWENEFDGIEKGIVHYIARHKPNKEHEKSLRKLIIISNQLNQTVSKFKLKSDKITGQQLVKNITDFCNISAEQNTVKNVSFGFPSLSTSNDIELLWLASNLMEIVVNSGYVVDNKCERDAWAN